jgi:glycosyltransferase involved in cell wall biosynthesis
MPDAERFEAVVDAASAAPSEPLLVVGGSHVVMAGGRAYLTGFFRSYGTRLASLCGHVDWLLPEHAYGIYDRFPVESSTLNVVPYDKHTSRTSWIFWRYFSGKRKALVFLANAVNFTPLILFYRYFHGMRYFIYSGNDFRSEMDNYRAECKPWKAWLWGFATRLLLANASGVIARGRHLQKLCQQQNANCIVTMPLGNMHLMSGPIVDATTKRAGGTLLFLGRLSEGKGMDLLLRAVASLRCDEAGRAMVRRLLVIGTGATEAANRALAQSLDIADVVEFRGFIAEPAEIADHLRQASLLVVPSDTFPEGVPRAIEEALSLRVPVVATAVGGVADEFDDGSVVVVEPGRVEALETAIAELLGSAEHYEAAVAAIERRMDGAGWRDPAEQHVDFMRSTLAG